MPMWGADQSFQTAIYYEDPDKNILELNVDNFTNVWAATEQSKDLPSQLHVFIDPEKLVEARKAGASPWEIHQRAFAGEFLPAEKTTSAGPTEPRFSAARESTPSAGVRPGTCDHCRRTP